MKFSTVIALMALFGTAAAFGQDVAPQVVASAGGDAKVGDVTIMWTVGEIAVTTLQNGNYYVTQGFHQPPRETTDAPYDMVADASVQVWPNPVATELFASVGDDMEAIGSVELLDMVGRSVMKTEGTPGMRQARLNVADLPSGSYVVRLVAGEHRSTRVVTIQR